MLPPLTTIIAIKPPPQPSPGPASPSITTTTAQLWPIRTLNWKRFVFGPPTGLGGCRCWRCCVCLILRVFLLHPNIQFILASCIPFPHFFFFCTSYFCFWHEPSSRQTTQHQSISGVAIQKSSPHRADNSQPHRARTQHNGPLTGRRTRDLLTWNLSLHTQWLRGSDSTAKGKS